MTGEGLNSDRPFLWTRNLAYSPVLLRGLRAELYATQFDGINQTTLEQVLAKFGHNL
jgi:hypothetical protein